MSFQNINDELVLTVVSHGVKEESSPFKEFSISDKNETYLKYIVPQIS